MKWTARESSGEVTKPATIRDRTCYPELNGLLCERIFGSMVDHSCLCGQLKGIENLGKECERCKSTLADAALRMKRRGHVTLAAPVVSIYALKRSPKPLSLLTGIDSKELGHIVRFRDHVVTDPGQTGLRFKQILNQKDYVRATEEHGSNSFTALMGAEAVLALLAHPSISETAAQICGEKGWNQREMVLDSIPVVPTPLRVIRFPSGGIIELNDLNELYRRIINRNNRLKKFMDLNAPEVVIRNQKCLLQQLVDGLLDNTISASPEVEISRYKGRRVEGRMLASLAELLEL